MSAPPDLWNEYTAFRTDMIEATRLGKLTPGKVADLLVAAKPRFPNYILDYEITAYRRSPDDWRTVVLPSRP